MPLCDILYTGAQNDIPKSEWPGREESKYCRNALKDSRLGERFYTHIKNFCFHLGVISLFCGIAYNNLITHSNRQNQYLKQTLFPTYEVCGMINESTELLQWSLLYLYKAYSAVDTHTKNIYRSHYLSSSVCMHYSVNLSAKSLYKR